jgi:hypothetical protein
MWQSVYIVNSELQSTIMEFFARWTKPTGPTARHQQQALIAHQVMKIVESETYGTRICGPYGMSH